MMAKQDTKRPRSEAKKPERVEAKKPERVEEKVGPDMRGISVGKVVVNIGVGKSGEAVERARKVLEQITAQKPASRKSKKSIRDFGTHKGEPIDRKSTRLNSSHRL